MTNLAEPPGKAGSNITDRSQVPITLKGNKPNTSIATKSDRCRIAIEIREREQAKLTGGCQPADHYRLVGLS